MPDIRMMTDEQLAKEIIELARESLKNSTVSKTAQYEFLGVIADFVKPELVRFLRQCVKDSIPSVEEIVKIIMRWDSIISDKGLAEDMADEIRGLMEKSGMQGRAIG